MIKFLQFNANRSSASHDLADKSAKDQNIGIILISEPNKKTVTKNSPGLFIDQKIDTAIKITDSSLYAEAAGQGPGYVWTLVQGYQIFSCYISPNITDASFINYLDQLKIEIRR